MKIGSSSEHRPGAGLLWVSARQFSYPLAAGTPGLSVHLSPWLEHAPRAVYFMAEKGSGGEDEAEFHSSLFITWGWSDILLLLYIFPSGRFTLT